MQLLLFSPLIWNDFIVHAVSRLDAVIHCVEVLIVELSSFSLIPFSQVGVRGLVLVQVHSNVVLTFVSPRRNDEQ